MGDAGPYEVIHEVVARLSRASWKEREAIKGELLEAGRRAGDPARVCDELEASKREVADLEIRWEIDEVIDALRPKKEPEPEPEPEPEEQEGRPLSAADLDLIYDDPRGLALHRSKQGDRWFATQRDPYTGQPRTFELHASEVQQLKSQLRGSPYWVLGSGLAG